MRSEVGDVKVDGSVNGISGPGAILALASILPNGVLLPQAKSEPKKLTFTLTNLRSFRKRDEYEFNLGVLNLDARVLGSTAGETNLSRRRHCTPDLFRMR